jgi:alanine-glyoxylate transaminase/serine-glyoxylate transaminase/serine-pyruvate transaminase
MAESGLPERLLMGPGPSNPYPEATAALGRPLLGHLDPEFLDVLDATCERLRTVFRTANPLTFPVSGTGSAGMEAAFVNLVQAGDGVLIGVNGLFGERMCEVASRCGAEVSRVEAPWGQPLDPEQVVDACRRLAAAGKPPRLVGVVHAETSTGVRNEVAPLGEAVRHARGDALLVVDTVTSLGGIEVDADGWGIDVSYSGTQKCLGVPPGLSPFTISPNARQRLVPRSPSWYLDLRLIAEYVESGGRRTYHHTAPVAMIRALHAALGVILAEGLENVWARHAECGALLAEGLQSLGLSLVAPEGSRLPELTTVWVPEGLAGNGGEAKVRAELLDRYGIEIGAGVGPMAGRAWRIGCMGHTARPRNVLALLGALSEVLGR